MNQYKVDLHVHSPASSDYKGDRSPKGYRELVKSYAKKDVHALAITDHNTLNGYLELCRQRDDSRKMYDLLLSRGEDAGDMAEEVAAFDQVDVIPGVEISVYPSLHIILLFNESVVGKVSDFLRNDLKLGGAVDTGDPKKISELSATAVLRRGKDLFGDDFFCILPHVESSKGAWSELAGEARAELMKDEAVLAAQILNPDTPQFIDEALKSRAYKRSKKLGYIQASDYHGSPSDDPANQYAILEVEGALNWESLKLVLCDQRNIRLSHEFIDDSYNSFVSGKALMECKFFNSLSFKNEEELAFLKQITALVNTPDSALVIELLNVSSECSRNPETIGKFVCDLQLKIDPPEKFGLSIRQFHRSNTRQRYCLTAASSSSLRMCNDVAWVAEKTGAVRAAESWEIEQKVINSFHLRYGKRKQLSLKNNADDLMMVSNSFPAFSIISRTERLLKRPQEIEYDAAFKKSCKRRPSDSAKLNGYSSGDYYYIGSSKLKGGRLSASQNAYYRFSAELHRDAYSQDVDCGQCEKFYPCIVVSRYGGASICLEDVPLSASSAHFVISSNVEGDLAVKQQSLLALLAIFKSSFFLWYMATVEQTTNLFDYLMAGGKIIVPTVTEWDEKLSDSSQAIVDQETLFLSKRESNQDCMSDSELNDVIDKYNNSVLDKLHDIDGEIYSLLSFKEIEVRQIYKTLSELDLFDYGIGDSIDEFIKKFSI